MNHPSAKVGVVPAATILLIFLYPWAHFVQLAGNLSLIDVAWLGIFVASLFDPRIFSRLLRTYASSYGALCAWFVGALLLSTMLSSETFEISSGFLQLAFVAIVTIPLAAVSISYLRRPLRVLLGICTTYLLLYLAGLILFLIGKANLVIDTGANRYDPVWRLGYHMLAVCGAIWSSRIALGDRRQILAYVGLLLVVIAIVFTGSRAATVSLLLSIGVAMMLLIRGRRIVKATAAAATGGLIVWFALAGGARSYLADAAPVLTRSIFNVPDRLESYHRGLDILLSDWKILAFGTGLGSYTVEGQVVHNLLLQTAVESGAFAGMALAAILVLPLWQLWRGVDRANETREALGGVFIWISLVPFFLGHPLSYERVFWLPFAFVLGLAIRARAAHISEPRPATPRVVGSRGDVWW